MDINYEIALAKEIAFEAHDGQFRKNGDPYIKHVSLVVSKIKDDKGAQVVAWLHDVLEDSGWTEKDLLKKGVSKEHVSIVLILTKKREQRYEDYIKNVSKSSIATRVKIADIISNLSDNPGNKQIVKFSKALIKLCSHNN